MSGIVDSIKSMAEAVAWPNKEEELGKGEHDAAVGATASHDPPEGLWDELHGDAGLRTIKTHGNMGEGHGSGLQTKAVNHQEELAARTRLQREGLFEPHLKHDELVNLSDRHREVAGGSTTFTDPSEDESRGENESGTDGERLV
ncbi:hypothetical protein JCM3770_003080 [Rhodotorula araucariae]